MRLTRTLLREESFLFFHDGHDEGTQEGEAGTTRREYKGAGGKEGEGGGVRRGREMEGRKGGVVRTDRCALLSLVKRVVFLFF